MLHFMSTYYTCHCITIFLDKTPFTKLNHFLDPCYSRHVQWSRNRPSQMFFSVNRQWLTTYLNSDSDNNNNISLYLFMQLRIPKCLSSTLVIGLSLIVSGINVLMREREREWELVNFGNHMKLFSCFSKIWKMRLLSKNQVPISWHQFLSVVSVQKNNSSYIAEYNCNPLTQPHTLSFDYYYERSWNIFLLFPQKKWYKGVKSEDPADKWPIFVWTKVCCLIYKTNFFRQYDTPVTQFL